MRDRGAEAHLEAELRCLSADEKVLIRALLVQHPIRRWYTPGAGGAGALEQVQDLVPGLVRRGLLETKTAGLDCVVTHFRLAASVGAAAQNLGWRIR